MLVNIEGKMELEDKANMEQTIKVDLVEVSHSMVLGQVEVRLMMLERLQWHLILLCINLIRQQEKQEVEVNQTGVKLHQVETQDTKTIIEIKPFRKFEVNMQEEEQLVGDKKPVKHLKTTVKFSGDKLK